MRKIYKLIVFIILFIPLIVNASSAEFELYNQKGGEIVTAYRIRELDIVQTGNHYYYQKGIENDMMLYQLFDFDFNPVIDGINHWRIIATKDVLIELDLSTKVIDTTSLKNTIIVRTINHKTLEEDQFSIEYDAVRKSANYHGDAIDEIYYNEHGLVVVTDNSTDIINVNIKEKTLTKVDSTYCYDNYEQIVDEKQILEDEEYNNFINYLFAKDVILYESDTIGYAVESENNYLTIIYKEGTGYYLLSTSKSLKEEIIITSIKNEDFGTMSVFDVELFSQKGGVAVILSAGYGGCPISNNFFEDNHECSNTIVFQQYHPVFKIDSKTDGNGSISTIDTSKSGESVTYKVTPNEGYKVEKIIITDYFGNKIEVKDEVFTMPSADVLIEATFIKNIPEEEPKTEEVVPTEPKEEIQEETPQVPEEVPNPNTSADFYFILGIAILIIGLIVIIKNKEKLDFLNE